MARPADGFLWLKVTDVSLSRLQRRVTKLVDTVAAAGVGVCPALLAFDFGRRWRSPRLYVDRRSAVTYMVGAVLVIAVLVVNLID